MFSTPKTVRRRCVAVVCAAFCGIVCAAAPAAAQVAFTFTAPNQMGVAGDITPLVFRASLSNGATPATIDAFSALITGGGGPALSTQPFADFLANPATPDPLPTNYSATSVDFFSANLFGATPGTYTGTASITYDLDGVTLETVTQPFSITITQAVTVPEYGSLLLALAGGGGVVMTSRRLNARRPRQQ